MVDAQAHYVINTIDHREGLRIYGEIFQTKLRYLIDTQNITHQQHKYIISESICRTVYLRK